MNDFCSLKSLTFALQTAHSMSFSPTMLRALVRQPEQSGCVQGSKMAREPLDDPQTEQAGVEAISGCDVTGGSYAGKTGRD